MKFILLDKTRIGDINQSQSKIFYDNYFLSLLKKTHPKIWETKNTKFLHIINNPSLLRSYEFLIKSEQSFQNFILVLERELYSFIQIKTASNFNIQDFLENKISVLGDEYFSDLEDEITMVHVLSNNKEVSQNKLCDPIKDKSSNFHLHKKEFLPKIKFKRDLTIKNTIPILKNFNPNYTKRTNVDKKIIRKFKNFIKSVLEKNNISNLNGENYFLFQFANGKFFPPFKFYDEKEKKQLEFKSFNSNYVVWIFSHEKIVNFYQEFLKDCGKYTLDSLIKEYNLNISENFHTKEIESLEFYLYHLAEVSLQERTNTESIGSSQLDCLTSLNLEPSEENDLNYQHMADQVDEMSPAPVIPVLSPSYSYSQEKLYENYLGIGENFELDLKGSYKTDLFNFMKNESNLNINSRDSDIKRNRINRNTQKKSDSDSDRSLERSRDVDYYLFDNLKKYWSDQYLDKEE